ncbi:hypothetical protein Aspvir_004984 [Aspergillus viridinutans]|uniref:Uncharacterized protein n=1 Tax=Aspergillus viridinutans TaxID=75553 RepID=A0A9P3BYP4_ASPVI|nr:uncharacterized protein Aspvir_004984 [Aspergillus viridinutans]GIK00954.1 hypothetical protein Aspvir_004984 [Aspergillus viridinutans]
MKIAALAATFALALVPSASAWRVGPGNPGFKCFPNVDPLNQKISSMSPGCSGDFGYEFCRNQFLNFADIGHDNDVSSYSTNCFRI